MNKFLGVLLIALIAAIAIPSAVLASQNDSAATIAKKKKKTYCQRTGASVKAKLKGKSHGFYAFAEKGGYGILICQDKPKFTGVFSLEQGDKISGLQVSPKKCAGVEVRGPAHNPIVYLFDFVDFLTGNGQASVYQVGQGLAPGTGSLVQFKLSSNCVAVFGQRVAGVPQIVVKGTNVFGYTGAIYPRVGPNMTDKELAEVKITASGATATASWTESGVKHTFVYVNNLQQPPNQPPTT
jgi:hypothetical protein